MVVPEDRVFWERIRDAANQVADVPEREITIQVSDRKAHIKYYKPPQAAERETRIVIQITTADVKKRALIVP